jgi:hypothetical protein
MMFYCTISTYHGRIHQHCCWPDRTDTHLSLFFWSLYITDTTAAIAGFLSIALRTYFIAGFFPDEFDDFGLAAPKRVDRL